MIENKLTEKQEKFIDKFYFVTEKYLFPKTKGKYFLKGSIGAILFLLWNSFQCLKALEVTKNKFKNQKSCNTISKC
ncbi:hypothetical protein LOS20_14315 [Enterococcus faecium]|nr:hypothetical protein [Enterococcus faecium]